MRCVFHGSWLCLLLLVATGFTNAVIAQFPPTGSSLQQQIDQAFFLARSFPDSAILLAEDLQLIAEQQRSPKDIASTLYVQAVANWYQGNYNQSLLLHSKAYDIRKDINDSLGLARSINNLGLIAQVAGDEARARDFFRRSFDYRVAIDDKVGMIYSAVNLGIQMERSGIPDSSDLMMQLASDLARVIQDDTAVAFVSIQRGLIEEGRNNWLQAAKFHEEAIGILQNSGDLERLMNARLGLAWCQFQLNPNEPSDDQIAVAREAVTQARLHEWNLLLSDALLDLSHYYRASGNPAEAYQSQHEHLVLYKQLSQSEHQVQVQVLTAIHQHMLEQEQEELNKAREESMMWEFWLWIVFFALLVVATVGVMFAKGYLFEKREKNQLEEENRESLVRQAELRRFSATVSHDIKEPIRSFLIFVELMKRKNPDSFSNPEVKDAFQEAKSRMMDLDYMLRDLEVYSGLSEGTITWETVDLNQVFARVCRDYRGRIETTSAQVQADELPTIIAQNTLMYQIFSNLISNGLKFHQPDQAPVVTVSCNQTDHGYKLAFQDNGIGIPETCHKQIFQAFERGNAYGSFSGSGLGLAIVAQAVHMLEGTISVESEMGKGSVFTIEIPEHSPVADVPSSRSLSYLAQK